MTAFAYCRDCNELTTGVMDLSKGFLLGSETNHIGCKVTYLDPGDPATPRPIAAEIARLATRPETCTDNGAVLMRLALELHDLKETACPQLPSTAPAAAPTSTTSPAPAPASAASTRSQPASVPTSTTDADSGQLALFGGVA